MAIAWEVKWGIEEAPSPDVRFAAVGCSFQGERSPVEARKAGLAGPAGRAFPDGLCTLPGKGGLSKIAEAPAHIPSSPESGSRGTSMQGGGSRSPGRSISREQTTVSDLLPENTRWPERLRAISEHLLDPRNKETQERARGEAWQILNGAISLYLRLHARVIGSVTPEDLEDLAAEKSWEVLTRIESGRVDFQHPLPPEIASYLSKVARNSLVSFVSKAEHRARSFAEGSREKEDRMGEPDDTRHVMDSPDAVVERQEFAGALVRCVEELKPRQRIVWFFRVFFAMPSKDIALHPEVSMSVGNVDVQLQRTRRTIRDCMRRLGHEPREMPPGAFTEVWTKLRREGTQV